MGDDQKSLSDEERRIAPRTRTLKRARVVFNNRYSTVDCVVRNLSRTGALLSVETTVQLPKQFEIAIDERELRPARLVYRRETFAGIHFLDVGAEENLPDLPQRRPGEGDDMIVPPGGKAGIVRIEPSPLPQALRDQLPWRRFV